MASVTVRDLDDGTKRRLHEKAKASGLSLEAYLRALLEKEASVEVDRPRFLDLLRQRQVSPELAEAAHAHLEETASLSRRPSHRDASAFGE